ncbi:Zinc finger protein, partial [Trichinella britovi]
LMSPSVGEDRQLREKLALRRLEEVLQCQQRERIDSTFCRQCLFCRYTVHGNRSQLIHHLYLIHRLNLGSPDNMVFVTEYIDILSDMIRRNQCLYCEEYFADNRALMEHMRIMQHREVNPKNVLYDKFYVINYLRNLAKNGLKYWQKISKILWPHLQTATKKQKRNRGTNGMKKTSKKSWRLFVCCATRHFKRFRCCCSTCWSSTISISVNFWKMSGWIFTSESNLLISSEKSVTILFALSAAKMICVPRMR